MGVGTIGENAQRQTPTSKGGKAKMEEMDGGRAKGAKDIAAKRKDMEARAVKDMAAKAKERAKDTEAKACMVWI